MKILAALFISICVVSCGHETDKQPSTLPANKKDTSPSLAMAKGTGDRWHFNKYLNDPGTPPLAKNIFHNHWKLKDDEPLDYLEKLHGPDKEARPFYFRVVTNSNAQSDGAYAEGLGGAGYDYVERYPDEFSNYFVGPDAFSEEDLQTWADIVMLEMEIVAENEYDQGLMTNYLATVRKNCKGCTAQQKEVIERFGRYLNERWTEYVKHLDR